MGKKRGASLLAVGATKREKKKTNMQQLHDEGSRKADT